MNKNFTLALILLFLFTAMLYTLIFNYDNIENIRWIAVWFGSMWFSGLLKTGMIEK